ncbi:barstar family protein [Brevundimonas sp.]|uniref:barstar family protein n=1 Tax=Brevundimonas sp. TaxID=1871086 RepID=UPI003D6C9DB6
MEAHIDGRTIKTTDDFYEAFARIEGVPNWFGRNLDALWDTVTGLLEKPVTLDWRNFQASRDAMGPDFETLIELLLQAQAETASAPDRVRFELKLDGQPG